MFLVWLAATILFQAILTKTRSSKLRIPPGPLALPIIGHFHLLQPSLHKAVQKISNHYGPIIQLYLGSNPGVFVVSAEIAKEILKTHEICFANRPGNTVISFLTYGKSDFAFAPYGTFWKFMKKLCMSELLNGRMLDQLSPIRGEEIKRFLETLRKKGEANEGVNLADELLKLTNSTVMRMAISKSCFDSHHHDEADKVIQRVKESSMLSAKFNLQDHFWFCKGFDFQGFGKRMKEVRGKFDVMLEGIIREHEEDRRSQKSTANNNHGAKDVLDAILRISEDPSSEVKITRDNIKGFLMDMLSGGTDTTAVTVEWALAELINHPTAMEKARKEIDSLVTSSGKHRIVMESDIQKLPYIQAIVKETLRLHPPAPFIMRAPSENCTIAGFHIPARTKVFINVWAIGRDPKNWDDPLEFKPERFLLGQGFEVRGQHYQLLPFGSGRRGCPGTSLALNVAHTCLATMIQCFEWKVVGDGDGVGGGVDMEEGPSFILSRAKPLICVPKPRLMPFPSLS
ncbi:hypothetical protein PIB30_072231 [Stylosanthes scabra]|uniref:3,9-dihydroxypterocarpan 6A-monooxygenase n=1 Tax=Stylosanthes scabra TaxID=79078 RepID=A0ABU6SPY7_9FABA|nr:hypothetical protein [Stylosanthes scabra]